MIDGAPVEINASVTDEGNTLVFELPHLQGIPKYTAFRPSEDAPAPEAPAGLYRIAHAQRRTQGVSHEGVPASLSQSQSPARQEEVLKVKRILGRAYCAAVRQQHEQPRVLVQIFEVEYEGGEAGTASGYPIDAVPAT